MENPENQETEVELGVEEKKEEGATEVDLDKKEAAESAGESKKAVGANKGTDYVDREEFQKALKRMEYQSRQMERERREMEALRSRISNAALAPNASGVTVEDREDEIDELATRDWKKAVELLAEKKLRDLQKEQIEAEKQNSLWAELEHSKSRVRERYPSVDIESSEEAKAYMEVLNENPSYLKNTHGPELAMYKMEERLRAQGRVPKEVEPLIDRELERRSRVSTASVTPGRHAAKPNTYVLSKDQKELCDRHKIPYEEYARNAKRLESGESLEV